MLRRFTALMLGPCLVLATVVSPARGQLFSWQRTHEGLQLTASDLELQKQAIQVALDENADGETRAWKNPESGHAGSVTPLRSYAQEGRSCRAFRLAVASNKSGELDLRACRHDDGTWKTY